MDRPFGRHSLVHDVPVFSDDARLLCETKRLRSHVLATIAKKDGKVIALMTYAVSSDGKTLTARISGTAEQVIVMDRK